QRPLGPSINEGNVRYRYQTATGEMTVERSETASSADDASVNRFFPMNPNTGQRITDLASLSENEVIQVGDRTMTVREAILREHLTRDVYGKIRLAKPQESQTENASQSQQSNQSQQQENAAVALPADVE